MHVAGHTLFFQEGILFSPWHLPTVLYGIHTSSFMLLCMAVSPPPTPPPSVVVGLTCGKFGKTVKQLFFLPPHFKVLLLSSSSYYYTTVLFSSSSSWTYFTCLPATSVNPSSFVSNSFLAPSLLCAQQWKWFSRDAVSLNWDSAASKKAHCE